MTTHFILNDEAVLAADPPGLLVLNFLRRRRRLTGTKEGCREGDCGACVVLVGDLEGEQVVYRSVTSCLMPLGELHGRHLVTIEGLNVSRLSPVQQAIVDEGASQCGFCTPGIVVSLTGMLMEAGAPADTAAIKTALSGHLCRCTGYRSLKAAASNLVETMGGYTGIGALITAGALPAYFAGIPARLRQIPPPRPPNGEASAFVVAGGTDLYVQQGEVLPDAAVQILGRRPQRAIQVEKDHVRIGAGVTFEDFARHPEVRRLIPRIGDYMRLIASLQIRNRATVGGNLINASPIGDLTILLLALDARLVLQDGDAMREVPITRFYQGYKQLDKAPSELLLDVLIPRPLPGTHIHWEKVSKRQCLDIATVNSAIRVRCSEEDRLEAVGLAMGGVAPVPLFMAGTSAFLTGMPLTTETLVAAVEVAQGEIAPISDIRGSAEYKRLLVRQLLIAHFTTLFPERLTVEACYAASRR